VVALLRSLKQDASHAKLVGIIVAIGVNDAQRGTVPLDYVTKWKSDYAEMIGLARQLNSKVAVSTVLPVEDGMPLGTKYFDPALIEHLNSSIRQVASEKGVLLIDANKAFRRLKREGHYTTDGVHLTAEAYKIFSRELLSGVSSSCAIEN
jgi:lysophospholipase L1-like esterase